MIYLKKKNKPFIKIREPGGSKNSEKIRKLILDKNSNFNCNTDLLLYLAARSENINLIKKNIGKKIILIDKKSELDVKFSFYKDINVEDQTLIYICKDNTCSLPFTDVNLLKKYL